MPPSSPRCVCNQWKVGSISLVFPSKKKSPLHLATDRGHVNGISLTQWQNPLTISEKKGLQGTRHIGVACSHLSDRRDVHLQVLIDRVLQTGFGTQGGGSRNGSGNAPNILHHQLLRFLLDVLESRQLFFTKVGARCRERARPCSRE